MVKQWGSLKQVVVVAAFVAILCALVAAWTASAEFANTFPRISSGSSWNASHISPAPGLNWQFNMNQTGTPETIDSKAVHILRNNARGRNKGTTLRVYYPAQPSRVVIRINVIACELDATREAAGNFRINIGGNLVYNQSTTPVNGISPVCRPGGANELDETTFRVTWANQPGMGYDAASGRYYADVDVELTAFTEGTSIPQNIQQRITFRVIAVDETDQGQPRPSIGYRELKPGYRQDGNKTPARQYFGIQGSENHPNSGIGQWGQKVAIPFGMECNEQQSSITRKLTIYDVDTSGFGPVYIVVFRRNVDTGAITRLAINDTNFPNPADRLNIAVETDRFRSRASGSGQSSALDIRMERGYQYMLVLSNPKSTSQEPWQNVYSLRLPSDSIMGLVTCKYGLTPSISDVVPTFSGVRRFTPVGRINAPEDASVSGDHQWQITKMVFSGRPNGYDSTQQRNSTLPACGYVSTQYQTPNQCSTLHNDSYPANDRHQVSDLVGPLAVGSYVCYMTSVLNPTQAAGDDSTWRHSPLTCSVSGAEPRLQVWGHDIRVRGKINTSTQAIDSPAATWGSWGEYGVFSNRINRGMASGNGLLAGNPSTDQFDWSTLTFSNVNPASLGFYGGLSQVTFNENVTQTQNGDITMPNAVVPASITAGTRRVVRINGTLTINGNITYGGQPYTSVASIPRVVLVANNIIIRGNVTRIDPWLVSLNTGPNTGRISTCADANTGAAGVESYFDYDRIKLRSNLGGCANPLKFNSPVIADSIFLFRTRVPSATADNPAEIFNLRADTFLTSSSGGGPATPVASTDMIRELPPRF